MYRHYCSACGSCAWCPVRPGNELTRCALEHQPRAGGSRNKLMGIAYNQKSKKNEIQMKENIMTETNINETNLYHERERQLDSLKLENQKLKGQNQIYWQKNM
jgi:hypothetical protein